MKKLTFKFRNAEFYIKIDGRKITYIDRFGEKDLVASMTATELSEFNAAQTEDDLAKICRRDCASRGCQFVKEENS